VREETAAAVSVAFFALAPSVSAGAAPWLLARWQLREPLLCALAVAATVVGQARLLGQLVLRSGTRPSRRSRLEPT